MSDSGPFRNKLGAVFPDFECETSDGSCSFHELLDRSPTWTVLLAYAGSFDAVSATELSECHALLGDFQELGVKLVGLGPGGAGELEGWSNDVLQLAGSDAGSLGFTLVADPGGKIAERLDVLDLDPCASEAEGGPVAANALFVIGPDKTSRLCMLYSSAIGRNFQEVLRCLRSLFLTQDFVLATPADWQAGARLIVAPGLATEEAREKFGNLEIVEVPSGRPYLRYVDCPAATGALPGPSPSPSTGAKPAAAESPEVAGHRPGPGPADFRIKLGAEFPDFRCSTTKGDFGFHEFLDREPKWTVLFSHPKDFTPVCTTELGACQALGASFAARGVKLLGLSCDSVAEHRAWSRDVLGARGLAGEELDFPLIGDEDRSIAFRLGMLDPLELDPAGVPMPARAFFLICPDKRLRFSVIYPATAGRNFAEILRAIDATLLAQDPRVRTPAGWSPGGRVLVQPASGGAAAGDALAGVETRELASGRTRLVYADCPGAPGI